MVGRKCRFGYTEKSCVEKDFPPCGDNPCELPDRPIPQNRNRIKTPRFLQY